MNNKAESTITSQMEMLGQGMVNLPTLPTILTLVTLPSEAGERTDKQSCPILNIIRMFDDSIILTPPCTSHSGTPWPASPAFPPWPCWLSTHCRPTSSRCSLTQTLTRRPCWTWTEDRTSNIFCLLAMLPEMGISSNSRCYQKWGFLVTRHVTRNGDF